MQAPSFPLSLVPSSSLSPPSSLPSLVVSPFPAASSRLSLTEFWNFVTFGFTPRYFGFVSRFRFWISTYWFGKLLSPEVQRLDITIFEPGISDFCMAWLGGPRPEEGDTVTNQLFHFTPILISRSPLSVHWHWVQRIRAK
jgi:hypothetical protein